MEDRTAERRIVREQRLRKQLTTSKEPDVSKEGDLIINSPPTSSINPQPVKKKGRMSISIPKLSEKVLEKDRSHSISPGSSLSETSLSESPRSDRSAEKSSPKSGKHSLFSRSPKKEIPPPTNPMYFLRQRFGHPFPISSDLKKKYLGEIASSERNKGNFVMSTKDGNFELLVTPSKVYLIARHNYKTMLGKGGLADLYVAYDMDHPNKIFTAKVYTGNKTIYCNPHNKIGIIDTLKNLNILVDDFEIGEVGSDEYQIILILPFAPGIDLLKATYDISSGTIEKKKNTEIAPFNKLKIIQGLMESLLKFHNPRLDGVCYVHCDLKPSNIVVDCLNYSLVWLPDESILNLDYCLKAKWAHSTYIQAESSLWFFDKLNGTVSRTNFTPKQLKIFETIFTQNIKIDLLSLDQTVLIKLICGQTNEYDEVIVNIIDADFARPNETTSALQLSLGLTPPEMEPGPGPAKEKYSNKSEWWIFAVICFSVISRTSYMHSVHTLYKDYISPLDIKRLMADVFQYTEPCNSKNSEQDIYERDILPVLKEILLHFFDARIKTEAYAKIVNESLKALIETSQKAHFSGIEQKYNNTVRKIDTAMLFNKNDHHETPEFIVKFQ